MPTETAEQPVTATPEAEAPEAVVQDQEFEMPIGGRVFTALEGVHNKGRAKGSVRINLKLDLSSPTPFKEVEEVVGKENWNRVIMAEVVRPACNDATHDALENGLIDPEKWGTKFIEQFQPGTRRAGGGIKAIREKKAEVMAELSPYLLVQAKGETIPEEERNRFYQLLVEYSDLNEKEEAKQRKGKTAKKAA